MKHTRLYADADGDSHFQDVDVESHLPLTLPKLEPATHYGFVSAPAGWRSDWHASEGRNFFVVISGEWEINASDGETRRFGPGDTLLVEDMTGRGHSSRVITESLTVMVQLPNK